MVLLSALLLYVPHLTTGVLDNSLLVAKQVLFLLSVQYKVPVFFPVDTCISIRCGTYRQESMTFTFLKVPVFVDTVSMTSLVKTTNDTPAGCNNSGEEQEGQREGL